MDYVMAVSARTIGIGQHRGDLHQSPIERSDCATSHVPRRPYFICHTLMCTVVLGIKAAAYSWWY